VWSLTWLPTKFVSSGGGDGKAAKQSPLCASRDVHGTKRAGIRGGERRGRTVRPMRRGPGWVFEYSRCASRSGAPPQPYRIVGRTVNGDMCLARGRPFPPSFTAWCQGVGSVLCRRRSSGWLHSTHRISLFLLLLLTGGT
jgi:hypothetical protein